MVALSLAFAYGCFFAAQMLVWEKQYKITDFFNAFRNEFPTFFFGLTNANATADLRVGSILLILSVIIGVTSLMLFNKKAAIPFVMLLVASLVAYCVSLMVAGVPRGEATLIFLTYSGVFSFFYLISRLIDKLTNVKSL